VCVCFYLSIYLSSQRLGKNPLIVDRQRLGKILLNVVRQQLCRNVTVVTNTHATIEELLEASFLMWPVSYQGKQGISSSQNFLLLSFLFILPILISICHSVFVALFLFLIILSFFVGVFAVLSVYSMEW
jgi:hypothetical protein